ncbi:MAG: translational repressor RegA [Cytophagales bacterium]|jgi:hypothetical protein|nr:translational repressor RegA [Cytophagales bacterium]
MIENLIEVQLVEPDNFLLVKETLTRIGIASKKTNTLYQSCHILHKQGKYYIMHFKELFLLDGKKNTDFSENDVARRNTIVNLLEEWELIKIIDKSKTAEPVVPISHIKIISFKEKNNWILTAKYSIGNKK